MEAILTEIIKAERDMRGETTTVQAGIAARRDDGTLGNMIIERIELPNHEVTTKEGHFQALKALCKRYEIDITSTHFSCGATTNGYAWVSHNEIMWRAKESK